MNIHDLSFDKVSEKMINHRFHNLYFPKESDYKKRILSEIENRLTPKNLDRLLFDAKNHENSSGLDELYDWYNMEIRYANAMREVHNSCIDEFQRNMHNKIHEIRLYQEEKKKKENDERIQNELESGRERKTLSKLSTMPEDILRIISEFALGPQVRVNLLLPRLGELSKKAELMTKIKLKSFCKNFEIQKLHLCSHISRIDPLMFKLNSPIHYTANDWNTSGLFKTEVLRINQSINTSVAKKTQIKNIVNVIYELLNLVKLAKQANRPARTIDYLNSTILKFYHTIEFISRPEKNQRKKPKPRTKADSGTSPVENAVISVA